MAELIPKPRTEKQIQSANTNFAILRLRGALSLLDELYKTPPVGLTKEKARLRRASESIIAFLEANNIPGKTDNPSDRALIGANQSGDIDDDL